jgi:predicted nucleotidyltransferase
MQVVKAAIQVAKWLEKQGVRHFFIGGISIQYWAEPRMTRDVDITVLIEPKNFESFLNKAVETFKPRIPDAVEFAVKHRVLLLETKEGIPIDISLGIPGYEEEAWRNSIEVEFPPFGKLRLISAEDLIIHKCVAGRARDVEDVVNILVKQQLQLDVERIKSWLQSFREIIEEHDPLSLFEEAFKQAKMFLMEREEQ